MRKNSFIICIMTTLTVMCSCSRNDSQLDPVIRTVKIDTVSLYGDKQESVYPGKIYSNANASLAFRVAGTIARIPYGEGVFVRKGTVIAEMDARDYRIQVSATEAEYKEIKAMAERVSELYKRGSATKSDYEKAVYGLEQITAKYNAHKNQLADTRLIAPFDGYIQKKLYNAGETVGSGIAVIAMIGSGNWQVEINLPVQDYARRDDFQSFETSVSTNPDKKLPLELLELSPKGNASQLYKMTFRINNTDSVKLVAGMSAEVTIAFHVKGQALCRIPISAMFEKDNKTCVWVFTSEDEPLEARPVQVSEIRKDGSLIITQGLHVGEKVVSAGMQSIKEGMKVKPLPTVNSTNVGGLL